MKKAASTVAIMGIMVLLIFLSACGSAGAKITATSPAGGKSSTGIIKTDYGNALPVVNQLALGTFKLEENGTPLTAEQVSQLATLWKGYRALTNSSTTAPMELENLTGQIEQAYTEGQLQAIAGMELTMEDMIQIAQEMKFSLQASEPERGNREMTEEQQATRAALRSASGGGFSGGPGGGGPPGGMPPGGGMPGGGGFGPEAMSTPGAMETAKARGMPAPGGGGNLNSALVSALIEYLKSKAQ